MRLFTYMDHLAGVCSPAEIGTPWRPRWSPMDAELGLCSLADVGTVKPEPELDPAVVALNLEGAKGYAREAAAYHRNPDAYKLVNSPGTIKAVLDWIEADELAKKDADGGLRTMALEKIRQKGSNAALYRLVVSALADGDADAARRAETALALEPHELAMMIGSLADTLPEPLRVALGKRCFEPVAG